MAKSEWGTKRKCLKCGTFFYDMVKIIFHVPNVRKVIRLILMKKPKQNNC